MITSIQKLIKELARHGIEAGLEEVSKLEEYLKLVLKWSKKTTIVSKRIEENELLGLLFDSLIAAKVIEGKQVADLGTGAGFPGIPLAIHFPERRFTLVDVVRKKCIFLQYAKDALNLDNIEIFCDSWDLLGGYYDTVISMGTGLERVRKVAKRVLRKGGRFVYITNRDKNCFIETRNPFIKARTCVIVSRETNRD